MSGMHPSEEGLQRYVFDRAACPQEEIDHIGECPHCQALIAVYGFVAEELERLPAPVFEFDLAAAVMERIEAAGLAPEGEPGVVVTGREPEVVGSAREPWVVRPPREPWVVRPPRERRSSRAAMWMVIALAVLGPAWLFRKSAYFVFTDMSPDFYWVLLAAAGVVVCWFILRLQRKYHDVINLLNK